MIFGSVFIKKNQTSFFSKQNWNQFKQTGFSYFRKKPVQTGLARFDSGFFGLAQFVFGFFVWVWFFQFQVYKTKT